MSTNDRSVVRAAIGLRSTAQGLAWMAVETGIFERLGIDYRIVRMETAGPAAVAGLLNDDWDIAEVGAVPVVQSVQRGSDAVILLAPEPFSAVYILARADIASPALLSGGRIGVLTADGQTGISSTMMIQRWGLGDKVSLAPLGTYPRIYLALCAGEIEAGVLTADYRFAGAPMGLHPLVDIGEEFRFQGPIVASTRRFLSAYPECARAVVQGFIEAIHLFKTDRDVVLPLLRRHLGFTDDSVIQAIYDFYRPRFQAMPRPSIEGIQRILTECDPVVADDRVQLAVSDLVDLSYLEAIERANGLERLYGSRGGLEATRS